jgi:hypothetical protein
MCVGFMSHRLQCVFIRQVSRFEHIHGIIFLSIEAVVVGMNLFEVLTFHSAGCTEDQLWTGCADALIAVKSLFQQLAPEGPYARDAEKKQSIQLKSSKKATVHSYTVMRGNEDSSCAARGGGEA